MTCRRLNWTRDAGATSPSPIGWDLSRLGSGERNLRSKGPRGPSERERASHRAGVRVQAHGWVALEFSATTLELWQRLHHHLHEPKIRFGNFLESRAPEINYAPLLNERLRRPAIRDRHQHAPRREMRRAHRYPDPRAERVKPRRRGEFIGIKWMAIGHQFAAMFLAIPGSESLLRRGSELCARDLVRKRNKRARAKQQSGSLEPRLFHDRDFDAPATIPK